MKIERERVRGGREIERERERESKRDRDRERKTVAPPYCSLVTNPD